jgi:hypothetical protein
MNFGVFDPVFPTIVPVRPVRRSVFWALPGIQNAVLRNSIFVMVPGNRRINSFRSFARMSRHFLCCICCALGVPDGLVPIDRGILINYVEVLVRVFADLHFNGAWMNRHYYALLCDATNRARWRFVVEEDFSLPLYFSRLVGYRARMEDYPSRLFTGFGDHFAVYYCGFVRRFLVVVADSFARETGLMGSVEDDTIRFGVHSHPVSAARLEFFDLARLSLDGAPPGWCPDVFEGLGAHRSADWFRRGPPVLDFRDGAYVLSLAECRFVGRYLDGACRRFAGFFRYAFFESLLGGFLNFLEGSRDRDRYCISRGLPFLIEILVLRSGMLLGDHWGFVWWIGACLPQVGVVVDLFPTPPAFIGANLPMQNFGGGGHVATIVLDDAGAVLPMDVGGQEEVGFGVGLLEYPLLECLGEVVLLTNVFTGDFVVDGMEA